jgi:cystathionine beta-lyase/cystathionine gamma-synthase
MRPATQIVQGSQGVNRDADPLTTPIYETTTFVFENAEEVRAYNEGRSTKFLYSRYGNPTTVAVEKTIADVEGAEMAMLFASGMAATSTALLGLLKNGDEVVCSAAIYGGTLHLLADLFPHFGIGARFVTIEDLRQPERVIGPKTKVVWFESPINPTLRCVDVAAIGAACRNKGVTSIIDNTFASPINQRPIELGVDIVMESVTKYLNGHSDVTAGALAGPAALLKDVDKARRMLGGVVDPQAAYAIGRGMKTLAVRMQRHNANGLAVARWLEKDTRVATVYYPGLESHPDHALAKRQMTGFGGMVCVDLGGGPGRVERFFDNLKVFRRAASLGGVESLCSIPVLTSQWGHTDAQLAEAGVTRSMARLSIGLEDPQDLIEDLDQALNV